MNYIFLFENVDIVTSSVELLNDEVSDTTGLIVVMQPAYIKFRQVNWFKKIIYIQMLLKISRSIFLFNGFSFLFFHWLPFPVGK